MDRVCDPVRCDYLDPSTLECVLKLGLEGLKARRLSDTVGKLCSLAPPKEAELPEPTRRAAET